ANDKESHQFLLADLNWPQTKAEVNAFVSNPREIGANLFQALFKDGSPARVEFDTLSKQTERTIVLVLESPAPSTSPRASLDGVAWEYAYNKAKEEYVVEDCAFVRALPESERPANGRLKASYERVPLLFIPANPLVVLDENGKLMPQLNIKKEWDEVVGFVTKSDAAFDLWEMLPATPKKLQEVMAQFRDGLIIHFSGHGGVDDSKAILLFEEENGASNPLDAHDFAREIKDKAVIAFLSACQSAVAERTEFSNLARGLVKAGVPFALGMQFNLPDPFAPDISGQFYNYLAHGHSVSEAARQARRAVKRKNEFYVGMIALYAAHPAEVGILKWSGTGAQTWSTFHPADVSDLPSPASGLIGRQRELMRIGTRLLEGKRPLTVTLHGAGGIGKTALLWQALLRFAPSFDAALAIGLDPLPSLESVLGRIERFLGLPSPCANDAKEREALVRNALALAGKRTLLGLDNFETLNYALNEKGSDEEKTAKSLHTFFKSLAANGVTLCVTSREVTNLPGEIIEDIQGLSSENGGRLFQENVVRPEQKKQIYIEKTQQVSEMVGGHPLALRLLASTFNDQVGTSLDRYIEDLQSFLPKARDKWTEEDRQESLRASFDFTMNNLVKTEEGKELQVVLSRLSMFTAFFDPLFVLPVVTNKWPETDHEAKEQSENAKRVAYALWERSLLERIIIPSEEENVYLYRLQSALSIFAKEQLSDIESVKENYWKSMNNLASVAEDGVKKSPLIAQIALYAVPDLRIAAESKSDKDAALMQFRVSKLLQQLGMYNDALHLLEKSRIICEMLHHHEGRAAVIGEIGKIYTTLGKLDKGYELQKESLAIAKEFGVRIGEAVALGGMGLIEETHGNLDIAIQMQKENLAIAKQLGDQSRISVAFYNLANIYVTRGDLDEAMKLYQQSLEIIKELGDLQGESAILGAMAEIHVTRGRLDDAIGLHTQTLKIKESLGDIRGKAITIGNLAKIYVIHGNLDNAMKLYAQSLDHFNRLEDPQGKAATIGEIAGIYIRRGDLEKGLKLLQEQLSIIREMGNKKEEAVVLHNMAHIFHKCGDLKSAMNLYLQALE
ncbi:MAG: tetratricopeptide repeat protein, partial [Anaerolineales bacterium]